MAGFSLFIVISIALFVSSLIPAVLSHGNGASSSPVASTLNSWIAVNMKEYEQRKTNLERGFNRNNLDSQLVAAEEGGVKVITVRKDGTGNFKTVIDAINVG